MFLIAIYIAKQKSEVRSTLTFCKEKSKKRVREEKSALFYFAIYKIKEIINPLARTGS